MTRTAALLRTLREAPAQAGGDPGRNGAVRLQRVGYALARRNELGCQTVFDERRRAAALRVINPALDAAGARHGFSPREELEATLAGLTAREATMVVQVGYDLYENQRGNIPEALVLQVAAHLGTTDAMTNERICYADLYALRGRVERLLGREAEAQESVRRALLINPECDLAHFERGAAALRRGEVDAAREAFSRSPLNVARFGQAFTREFDQAAALIDAAGEDLDSQGAAEQQAITVLRDVERTLCREVGLATEERETVPRNSACRLAQMFEMINPELRRDYEDMLCSRGQMLRSQNTRIEEALVDFETADALRPNDIETRANIGMCQYWLGRLREARATLEQAFELPCDENAVDHTLLRTAVLIGERAAAEIEIEERVQQGEEITAEILLPHLESSFEIGRRGMHARFGLEMNLTAGALLRRGAPLRVVVEVLRRGEIPALQTPEWQDAFVEQVIGLFTIDSVRMGFDSLFDFVAGVGEIIGMEVGQQLTDRFFGTMLTQQVGVIVEEAVRQVLAVDRPAAEEVSELSSGGEPAAVEIGGGRSLLVSLLVQRHAYAVARGEGEAAYRSASTMLLIGVAFRLMEEGRTPAQILRHFVSRQDPNLAHVVVRSAVWSEVAHAFGKYGLAAREVAVRGRQALAEAGIDGLDRFDQSIAERVERAWDSLFSTPEALRSSVGALWQQGETGVAGLNEMAEQAASRTQTPTAVEGMDDVLPAGLALGEALAVAGAAAEEVFDLFARVGRDRVGRRVGAILVSRAAREAYAAGNFRRIAEIDAASLPAFLAAEPDLVAVLGAQRAGLERDLCARTLEAEESREAHLRDLVAEFQAAPAEERSASVAANLTPFLRVGTGDTAVAQMLQELVGRLQDARVPLAVMRRHFQLGEQRVGDDLIVAHVSRRVEGVLAEERLAGVAAARGMVAELEREGVGGADGLSARIDAAQEEFDRLVVSDEAYLRVRVVELHTAGDNAGLGVLLGRVLTVPQPTVTLEKLSGMGGEATRKPCGLAVPQMSFAAGQALCGAKVTAEEVFAVCAGVEVDGARQVAMRVAAALIAQEALGQLRASIFGVGAEAGEEGAATSGPPAKKPKAGNIRDAAVERVSALNASRKKGKPTTEGTQVDSFLKTQNSALRAEKEAGDAVVRDAAALKSALTQIKMVKQEGAVRLAHTLCARVEAVEASGKSPLRQRIVDEVAATITDTTDDGLVLALGCLADVLWETDGNFSGPLRQAFTTLLSDAAQRAKIGRVLRDMDILLTNVARAAAQGQLFGFNGTHPEFPTADRVNKKPPEVRALETGLGLGGIASPIPVMGGRGVKPQVIKVQSFTSEEATVIQMFDHCVRFHDFFYVRLRALPGVREMWREERPGRGLPAGAHSWWFEMVGVFAPDFKVKKACFGRAVAEDDANLAATISLAQSHVLEERAVEAHVLLDRVFAGEASPQLQISALAVRTLAYVIALNALIREAPQADTPARREGVVAKVKATEADFAALEARLAPGEESESFQVWVNLSAAYALVYDFAAAERWFEKILAKDVTHAGARLMRAQLLLIRDRFVETRIAAKEAFTAFGSGAAMGADSASVFDVQMNMHFIAKCPAELILIDAEATARMGDVAGALKTLAKGKSVECVLWAAKIAAVVATDATQAKRLLGVAETARAAESRPYAEQEAVVRDLTLAKIAELEGRVLDAMDAYERLIPRLSREWGYGYLEALTRAQHAAAHAIIGAHCLLKAREGDADVTEYNEHAQNLFEFALQHAEALMEKYPFVPAGKRIAIPVLRQLAQIDRALDMIEWLLDNDVLFDHRTLGNLLVMASEFEMGGATAATRARARTILARTRGVVGDRIFAVLFNEAVKRTIVSIFPDWTPALLGEGPWPAVDEK